MSDSERHQVLHPTRIDIPPEIRLFLITLLNQALACTADLRSQVKHAAWNVKGNECSQLQALFTTIATELDEYADLMAERIVVLGGVAYGTVRSAAVQSRLPEYPSTIRAGNEHALALAERFAQYAKVVRANITSAMDVEDPNTSSIYADISRGIETRLGTLEAYLLG